MLIRIATAAELPALQDIEVAAGRAFAVIGMPEIASDEPLSLDTLDRYRRDGNAWVATDPADRPIGYLIAEPIDDALHVEQVSVHPDHAGHGIGAALINQLDADALTLTTFRDVPWNAPYYRRLGFTDLDDAALPAGLRAVRDHEIAAGYDRWPRLAMRRNR